LFFFALNCNFFSLRIIVGKSGKWPITVSVLDKDVAITAGFFPKHLGATQWVLFAFKWTMMIMGSAVCCHIAPHEPFFKIGETALLTPTVFSL